MAYRQITAKLLPTALGLATTLLFGWAQFSDVPLLQALKQRAESMAYDLRLNTSLAKDASIDPRIVIIDIDEKSLGAEGRWPWPRNKIAELTDRLFEAGAVVVGFDIFFSEPERNKAQAVLQQIESDTPANQQLINSLELLVPAFDNDRRLADSLADRDVTLGYLFHEEETAPVGNLPQPLLTLTPEQAKRSGIKAMPNYTASVPLLQESAISSGFVTTWPDLRLGVGAGWNRMEFDEIRSASMSSFRIDVHSACYGSPFAQRLIHTKNCINAVLMAAWNLLS